jgi:hypothetical protein
METVARGDWFYEIRSRVAGSDCHSGFGRDFDRNQSGLMGREAEKQKQILRSPPPNSAPKSTNRFLGTSRSTSGALFAQDDTAAHRLTKKYRYPARLWQWLKNEPALTSEKNPYAYDNQNRI